MRRETERRTVALHAGSWLGQIRSLQIGRCEAASQGASVRRGARLCHCADPGASCSSSKQRVPEGTLLLQRGHTKA